MPLTRTCNLTSGSDIVDAISPGTSGLYEGMEVTARTSAGLNPGTEILSIVSGTSVQLSQNAIANATGDVLTFRTLVEPNVSAGTATMSFESLAFPMRWTVSANLACACGLTANVKEVFGPRVELPCSGSIAFPLPVALARPLGQILIPCGSAGLTDVVRVHAPTLLLECESSLIPNVEFDDETMTVYDAINDVFSIWGIEDASIASEDTRARALSDLNASMQLLWGNSPNRDYFTRQTISATYSANVYSYQLPSSVQNIIGTVRRSSDRKPLRAISSRAQFDLYGPIFAGTSGTSQSSGTPEAYFAERQTESGNLLPKINLLIAPTPIASTTLYVDVALECPRYRWSDYCNRTRLTIPHGYVESILLPLCRYRAMSSDLFTRPERAEFIKAENAMAMAQLGLVDPLPKDAERNNGMEAQR